MTDMQEYAIAHPIARANPQGGQQAFRRVMIGWSMILTVNK
jgi:hypothetical protein